MAMYLVDSNVMLAASAVFDLLSNAAERAMPKEVELREIIYSWLDEFSETDEVIVLDEEGLIRDEYERQMPFNKSMQDQEFGMQVLQNKLDRALATYVPIDVDECGGDAIAILEDKLTAIVHDREDRKWVASSIATNEIYNEVPPIVYGAESDWYLIEAELAESEIYLLRLLPEEWYEAVKAGK